ncbi:MAG: hypothetical protein LBF27_12760 [Sphingobacterium sp.]|jgi:hypothetical protein|nr:hypothetical protein [Sphingobacterium sp.]
MKLYPTVLMLVLSLSVVSCHQEKKDVKGKTDYADTMMTKTKPELAAIDSLKHFHTLYPIDILKPESKDVFKKYGIEFSGICYNCDLAELKITKDLIQFVNVCDSNEVYQVKKFNYAVNDSILHVKTEHNEFIFQKVEKEPVFELKITGEPFILKNKRIAKFYTQKALIEQFEVHDCGDFQG